MVVLEFDHRDRSKKIANIGEMICSPWSMKKIESEVEKCDVRCSNCHKRVTAIQFNWYATLA